MALWSLCMFHLLLVPDWTCHDLVYSGHRKKSIMVFELPLCHVYLFLHWFCWSVAGAINFCAHMNWIRSDAPTDVFRLSHFPIRRGASVWNYGALRYLLRWGCRLGLLRSVCFLQVWYGVAPEGNCGKQCPTRVYTQGAQGEDHKHAQTSGGVKTTIANKRKLDSV